MSTSADMRDVVVVGAGLAGALVARQLAEAGLSVSVLEAGDHPGGLAQRGLGLALFGTPEPFTVVAQRAGAAAAQEWWELSRENLALMAATLEAYHLPVQRSGSLRPTGDHEGAQHLQKSVAVLQQAGYAAELEDVTDWGYLVALRTNDDLIGDMAALITTLLKHPQIDLQLRTEVQQIEPRMTGGTAAQLSVWAHKHYLWTQRVVLANGAHAAHLNRNLSNVFHLQPLHIAELRATTSLPAPLVFHQGELAIYEQKGQWRAVGWRSDKAVAWAQMAEVIGQLDPKATVAGRYSGWVAQSKDGMPVVGQMPDQPGVYTLNGLGPWGVSWAFVAAQRLVQLLLNGASPGRLDLARLWTG